MNTWMKLTACAAALFTTLGMMAQETPPKQPPPQPPPPLGLKNVEMSVKLMSPISTKTSKVGDKFTAQVLTPEAYNTAFIEGHISTIKEAKNREKAEISFQFDTLTFQGLTHPIQADLKDFANSKGVKLVDEEGRAIGTSSKKKAVESALIGSAIGGITGGALAGGKGAAMGAGAGAAAGLLFAIKFTTSGDQIEFSPGSTFNLDVSDHRQHL